MFRLNFKVFSKEHELLWIVHSEEDAKRLCQGTHYYKPITSLNKSENKND